MSLVATLAQDFRPSAPEFSKFEFRISEAGAYNAFYEQSMSGNSWLTPDLVQKAQMSPGRSVTIPVINYKDVTIRTTRPLVIAADENTSALYTVQWVTFAYGFLMYPMQHYNNEIAMQQDFNAKFKAFLVKLTAAVDTQALTVLEAAKTQVLPVVPGGHTFASNVVSETAATRNDSYILSDLDPIMRTNDFQPYQMHVIGNQGFNSIMRRMEGFGTFNHENKTLQYDSKRFGFSNRITNAVGKTASGFAIGDGTLGMLTRVEPDSQYRTRLKTGHEWDTVMLPGLGINVGTYKYDAAVDASGVAGAATAHLTRTGAMAMDFAVDIAFIAAYNSDRTTIPSSIVKFDVAIS